MDRAARRGRRARALRRRAGRGLLRGGDARRARAGRVPRAVPRALDAGQRVVGVVRPGGEPVLGRAGRSAVGRLHHAQRDGRAGGRRRLVAGRRALRQGGLLRLRAPRAGGVRGRDALAGGRALGRDARRVRARLGRRPRRRRPARAPRSSSRARRSATPARCASGIRRCPPAPTGHRRPSVDSLEGRRRRDAVRVDRSRRRRDPSGRMAREGKRLTTAAGIKTARALCPLAGGSRRVRRARPAQQSRARAATHDALPLGERREGDDARVSLASRRQTEL